MIILKLFWEFFKIGLFTFGGAYGAIPLIRESVKSNDWLTDEAFSDMIAISESTPGPIMVNAATYIGNTQGGISGAAAATFGVVLPSFIIIILISAFLKKAMNSKPVSSVLSGIKPCLAGIILATGLYMAFSAIFSLEGAFIADFQTLLIFAVLIAISAIVFAVKKKNISPIVLICISAVLGILLGL